MANEFAEVWLQSDICEADFDSMHGGVVQSIIHYNMPRRI